jgi:nicotinamidase-related amidase
MKQITPFVLLFLLAGCHQKMYTTRWLPPEFLISDTTKRIILIDRSTVFTSGIVGLKKKQAIIRQVKAEFFSELQRHLQQEFRIPVLIDSAAQDDHAEKAQTGQALYTLVYTGFDEGFTTDYIEKAKDENGVVTKTAYYSVYCNTTFELYDSQGTRTTKQIEAKREHSNAVVAGLLLDAGPSFKDNKPALSDIAKQNIQQTAQLFKPREIQVAVPR